MAKLSWDLLWFLHQPQGFPPERCKAGLIVAEENLVTGAKDGALVVCQCGWFNPLRDGKALPAEEPQ